MTREQLKAYSSKKEEIKEITYKLAHLWENDEFIGNDVINDYRSGFPVPQSIVGADHERYWRKRDRYNKRLEELVRECSETEEYIESISDSMTRRIFRMYFIEGIGQQKIAKRIHTDQSTVSRRINEYLEYSLDNS